MAQETAAATELPFPWATQAEEREQCEDTKLATAAARTA